HLHGVGAADEQQQLVDDEGYDQHVERVAPAELGRGQEGLQPLQQRHASPPRIASATRATSLISATSWTRTMWAPCITAAATAAAAGPHSPSPTSGPSTAARKPLREGPTSSGRSSARGSASRRITSRLWTAPFEKPIPGSTIICSRAMPARSPRASAS